MMLDDSQFNDFSWNWAKVEGQEYLEVKEV